MGIYHARVRVAPDYECEWRRHETTVDTEFGVDAPALVRAWGVPKSDPCGYFDRTQSEMILDSLEFNSLAGLYQKCFAHQYAASLEGVPDELAHARLAFPAGLTLEDYSYGFTRRDGMTMKPVFIDIITHKVNDAKKLKGSVKRSVRWLGKKITVSTTTDYPARVQLYHKDSCFLDRRRICRLLYSDSTSVARNAQ